MSKNQNEIVTFSLQPRVQKLIAQMAESKHLYYSQVVEAGILLLAEKEGYNIGG